MKKAVFEVGGKEYPLTFDLYAMELIEEEYGSIQKAFQAMQEGDHMIRIVGVMFAAMANSARSLEGLPEDVTPAAIRHMEPYRINELQQIINKAVSNGMKVDKNDEEDEDE